MILQDWTIMIRLSSRMSAHTAHSPSFQTTRWTHVARLRDGADEAERERILTQFCHSYWFPLYGYARRSGKSPHDAEDLTQGFFHHALGSDLFAKARQDRGRLRSFLLTSFQHYLNADYEKATAAKRGGKLGTLSLDAMQAEDRYQCEPADITTPEDLYNRRWARDFFVTVKEHLRAEYEAEGKAPAFDALQPWLFIEAKAAEWLPAAASLGVTEGNFRVMLTRFRKRYRDRFREAVADTLDSPTPEQIDHEIRDLICLGAQ